MAFPQPVPAPQIVPQPVPAPKAVPPPVTQAETEVVEAKSLPPVQEPSRDEEAERNADVTDQVLVQTKRFSSTLCSFSCKS